MDETCSVFCEPVPDTLSLQEFGTRSTSDATISSRLNASEPSGRNTRKGYHRLQGEGPDDITVLQQQPSTVTQPPTSYSRMSAHNQEECTTPSSGSSESSSDNEKDYFEGFTDTDDGKCPRFLDWYPCTYYIPVRIFYMADVLIFLCQGSVIWMKIFNMTDGCFFMRSCLKFALVLLHDTVLYN
ncbi:uncharacterized protein TNIN_43821 [Trichonephila inaurata madagascariensis]|uniref:Uncharacterized protein n=1 Tax=Trichonephila inaurata madagascariensis TaxID=2747483 RepID=A0A8X7BPU0_9ARAC|nr:uncharacterized protein TNIN_43821 [Trichonephila inaurata madagascariensis]